jgi:hypothetical protein
MGYTISSSLIIKPIERLFSKNNLVKKSSGYQGIISWIAHAEASSIAIV